MAGYFGTPEQQRLQAIAEDGAGFVRATPGACQTARFPGCDDPDRFGWDRIAASLDEIGICGFRLIPARDADRLRDWLAARGARLDTWDVFVADRASALPVAEAIVARGLPDGFRERDPPAEPDGDLTRHIQATMAAAGVAPFSGSFLTGAYGPSATVVVSGETGDVVGTAHAYLPHNAVSPWHRHAWGGLVAVAEAARGHGIGTYVNARVVARAFRDLGAAHVYELVSSSNVPSRRMVEAAGLRHDPTLICGIATLASGQRFTR